MTIQAFAQRGDCAGGRRLRLARIAAATTITGPVVLLPSAALAAPQPGQTQPPGTQGLLTMLNWGGWLVSLACVAGILVCAAMMALKHRRGETSESLASLGWVMGACVLLAAAGPLASALT